MKDKLRHVLKKNKLFYIVLKLVKNRNNCEMLVNVENLVDSKSYDWVKIIPCGKDGTGLMPVCEIIIGNKNEGLLACVRWVLDSLYYCDTFGFAPVISFSDDSLYRDEGMFGDRYVFDYYFYLDNKYDMDYNLAPKILYPAAGRSLAEGLNNEYLNYRSTDKYISEMAIIRKKYLRFTIDTEGHIKKYISSLNLSEDILGVHIRGTDYKKNYKGHPKYIQPEDYYPYIDEEMRNGRFRKLFLATDDSEILDRFVSHYGNDNVIYAQNVGRATGTVGSHFMNNSSKYYSGLEVLSDMMALAKCGGIVSGMSQVALCARIFKKSFEEEYKTDIVIDKGINENGKIFGS